MRTPPSDQANGIWQRHGSAILGMTFLVLIVTWGYWHIEIDDAYIFYTYARNIATGQGYVFNPGERILGTTSPRHPGGIANVCFGLETRQIDSSCQLKSILGLDIEASSKVRREDVVFATSHNSRRWRTPLESHAHDWHIDCLARGGTAVVPALRQSVDSS